MFKRAAARARHFRLVTVAKDLVREACLSKAKTTRDVTPEQVIALAFIRHQLTIETDEARRYLDGALVSLGFPLQQPTA